MVLGEVVVVVDVVVAVDVVVVSVTMCSLLVKIHNVPMYSLNKVRYPF